MPTCTHPEAPITMFRYTDEQGRLQSYSGCKPCARIAKGFVPAKPEPTTFCHTLLIASPVVRVIRAA